MAFLAACRRFKQLRGRYCGIPPVKAACFSLRFPLVRIACYCVTVFAGTTGEGNVLLRDCFSFSTGEGNALLRDCFCGYH